MKKYDLVCQLGSQVMYAPVETSGIVASIRTIPKYILAPHTRMRTEASAIILRNGIAPRIMVLGGSNFGVRYDDNAIFGPQHPTQKAGVFTFEAFANANLNRLSEAEVIRNSLIAEDDIDPSKVFVETLSATTEENAEFLKIILKRRPDSKSPKGILGVNIGTEKIGILTLLYHMERALPIFQKAGLNVEPVFAENLLTMEGSEKIYEICKYYETPKGGKQYDAEKIYQLLTEGRPLNELWTSNPRRNPYDIDEQMGEFDEVLWARSGAANMTEALEQLHEWQLKNPPA